MGWWTVQSAIFALPLPITFGVLFLCIPPARPFFGWAFIATAIPGLAYMALMPTWRYRVHRWETTDDAVYAASGWLWQKWRVVPLNRIQTVDTLRGPIEQMFNLSGVTVTTASAAGAVKIHGLDHKLAVDVVQHLTKNASATAGDAT